MRPNESIRIETTRIVDEETTMDAALCKYRVMMPSSIHPERACSMPGIPALSSAHPDDDISDPRPGRQCWRQEFERLQVSLELQVIIVRARFQPRDDATETIVEDYLGRKTYPRKTPEFGTN